MGIVEAEGGTVRKHLQKVVNVSLNKGLCFHFTRRSHNKSRRGHDGIALRLEKTVSIPADAWETGKIGALGTSQTVACGRRAKRGL